MLGFCNSFKLASLVPVILLLSGQAQAGPTSPVTLSTAYHEAFMASDDEATMSLADQVLTLEKLISQAELLSAHRATEDLEGATYYDVERGRFEAYAGFATRMAHKIELAAKAMPAPLAERLLALSQMSAEIEAVRQNNAIDYRFGEKSRALYETLANVWILNLRELARPLRLKLQQSVNLLLLSPDSYLSGDVYELWYAWKEASQLSKVRAQADLLSGYIELGLPNTGKYFAVVNGEYQAYAVLMGHLAHEISHLLVPLTLDERARLNALSAEAKKGDDPAIRKAWGRVLQGGKTDPQVVGKEIAPAVRRGLTEALQPKLRTVRQFKKLVETRLATYSCDDALSNR